MRGLKCEDATVDERIEIDCVSVHDGNEVVSWTFSPKDSQESEKSARNGEDGEMKLTQNIKFQLYGNF